MGMACDAEGSGAFRPRGPSLGRSQSQGQRFPEGLVVSTGGNLPSAATAALSMAGPTRLGETSSSCDTATTNPFRMNTEETAMILTSLSKGQFAFGNSNGNSHHAAVSSGESDGEDFSHDEDDDDDDMMNGSHYPQHGQDQDGGGSTPPNKLKRVQQINFDGPMGSKLDFMDDHGFSHRFRNESNRVKSLVTKHISIDELRAHFDRPIIDVAKDFGICITLMKKICRRNGIKRWPHRQIRSLSKSIASMEAAMLSAHGSERDKYRDQILNLKLKRESVIADPNKDNHHHHHQQQHQMSRPKTPTRDMGSSRPHHHVHVSPSTASSSSGTYAMGAMAQQMPTLGIKMESYHQHRAAENTTSVSHGPVSNGANHHPNAHHQSNHHAKGGRWTSEEHAAFLEGIRLYGKDWRSVAQVVMTRSAVQTRTHAQKYLLKFAGRFPFDTDGLLKDPAHQHHQHHHESIGDVKHELEPQEYQDEHQQPQEVNGTQAWPLEPVKEPVVPVQKSRHETMAMLLNSPYIEPAPEPSNGPVSPVFAGTSNSGSSTSSASNSPIESDVAKLAPLDDTPQETTSDNNVVPA